MTQSSRACQMVVSCISCDWNVVMASLGQGSVVPFLHFNEVWGMERRRYERIRIDAASQFSMSDTSDGSLDFAGIIEDISEGGIRIVVSEAQYLDIADKISVGSEVIFQAMDEYMLYMTTRTDEIHGNAKVVRVEKYDDKYVFGCEMHYLNSSLEEYIVNRKAAAKEM